MDTAGRIRLARRQAQLSQQALGKQLGVQRSAVSNWESNNARPSMEHLVAIAEATNASVDWLATGHGRMQPDYDPKDEILAADVDIIESPIERELLERFRQAPQRTQGVILSLMEVLVPVRRQKK
ncbi:helix-turn-helix domain-containing protein [Pseudoxanthomonas suwonensis]